MRILIACEFTGLVRDAFTARGHYAMSCDLLPTERSGPHYMGDVREVLYDGWDMLIGHPPCQYLTYAGIGYFNEERYGQKALDRIKKRDEALEFFKLLYNAPIPKVALENPVGWVNTLFKPADQIIHPYYFGDSEKKRTCLWLKGLPKLVHVKADDLFSSRTYVDEPEPYVLQIRKPGKHYKGGELKPRYFVDSVGGKKGQSKERSKTFPGIAAAFAAQWG